MIPKFRAYSKEENEMYYPHNDKNVDWTIDDETGFIAPLVNLGGGMWGMIDKYELMQSTGLKDKNGVEIFEGDLVSISVQNGFDCLDNKVCIVKNSIEHSGLVCATIDEDLEYRIFNTELFEEYTYEVIGNIYENPEFFGGTAMNKQELTVEKEPLYEVIIGDLYLIKKFNNRNDFYFDTSRSLCAWEKSAYQLTESEIKAIDERYWPFAVPVEEGLEQEKAE